MVKEEMDLDEWELLPKNSFKDLDLDQEDDHQESMTMDYFLCPSTQDPLQETESPSPRSIVVPIAWEPVSDHENNKKIPDLEQDPNQDPDSKQTLLTDSVPSPRVGDSFNNTKETEFVEMKKIDPPVKIMSPLPPQINSIGIANAKPSKNDDDDLQCKKEERNLWKIGVNGIGAICSFGVAAAAAATVCVFFLGHNKIKSSKNKSQMLRFQIYSDDNKRMKEVVNHATKLNENFFAMKGVPVVRAQISFGGYYDGL